jgi:carboxymethylenebutenolidase
MTDIRDRAVRLYDAYTHDHRDRRELLRGMTALLGSIAAAETMIGGIAASSASAAVIAADDKRIAVKTVVSPDPAALPNSYVAAPRSTAGKRVPVVLVIHENRGLNAHIEDVARRLAVAGFWAIAPDFLTPQGGTPADQDRARALIGSLDYPRALAQALALLAGAQGQASWNGKAGAVGFCWGGAFVNRLAVEADDALDAGVAYYGPAPSPGEAAKVRAPLMLHYAGKDARVATTGEPWVAALKAAGKPVEAFTYPGVDHAFSNDTSVERYDKAAADLAWGRTIAFLRRELDA